MIPMAQAGCYLVSIIPKYPYGETLIRGLLHSDSLVVLPLLLYTCVCVCLCNYDVSMQTEDEGKVCDSNSSIVYHFEQIRNEI